MSLQDYIDDKNRLGKQVDELKKVVEIERKHFDELNREKNQVDDQIKKLKQIIDIDTVGWANPKVLIDTIKREVFGESN
jgi:hypothetical protein